MAPGSISLKLIWRRLKPVSPAGAPSVNRASSVIEPPSSWCRFSSVIWTPSIDGRGAYDCTWNACLAWGVHSTALRSRLDQAQEVLSVGILAHRLGDPHHVERRDVAHLEGDLLEARDHQPLPVLDRLDEGGRLQERLVRARVEPGDAAAEPL